MDEAVDGWFCTLFMPDDYDFPDCCSCGERMVAGCPYFERDLVRCDPNWRLACVECVPQPVVSANAALLQAFCDRGPGWNVLPGEELATSPYLDAAAVRVLQVVRVMKAMEAGS